MEDIILLFELLACSCVLLAAVIRETIARLLSVCIVKVDRLFLCTHQLNIIQVLAISNV